MDIFEIFTDEVKNLSLLGISGYVVAVKGMTIEVRGLEGFAKIGSLCKIITASKGEILCEIVGFRNDITILLAYSEVEGIASNDKVTILENKEFIMPSKSLLGRVVNGFGEPIDNLGAISKGDKPYFFKNSPPLAHKRNLIKNRIDLGIRAVNTFVTCCYGQRIGIFAGSGVGKSVLISMMTKFSTADVKVIGLIGERGREVKEFIEEYLGPEGLKNSVVIAATSDEPPLLRKRAAYLTLTIAEYFRDQGKEVLCIMDSVTRFAMAQREIGLASGEPPGTKGYPPSVFSELPSLLERAGPGVSEGNITGIFTVLVEGDDMDGPVSDTVRGTLDGHITLDRKIAERGRFPAIDVLRSVSRTSHKTLSEKENYIIVYARKLLASYENMEEMIKIGAYKRGSDMEIDLAIQFYPHLESFLSQKPTEFSSLKNDFKLLAEILNLQSYYENTQDSDKLT